MPYVLGIDGGGTATQAVILDEHGRLRGAGRSGSANFDDIGEAAAQRSIEAAVREACRDVGGEAPGFDAAFLGLAGVISEKDRAIARRIVENLELADPERVGIDHDCRVALAGGLSGRPGLVLIAGTGSACFGLNAAGERWRAGGWGDLVADEGSGYWLGVRAMKAAVQAYDGRGPETTLMEQVMQQLRLTQMNDIMHRIHVEGLSRSETAALAPHVFEAAREGDDVAQALVREGANELANNVRAVAHRLGVAENAFELAWTGGLFRAGEVFTAPLEAALDAQLPNCRPTPAELPPVLGAGLLALEQLDGPAEPDRGRQLRVSARQLANIWSENSTPTSM